MRWTRFFATAVLSVLATACSSPSVEVRSQPACPPSFVAWPQPFQVRIADGLQALPRDANGDAVRLALRQSINMRTELRAAGCKERPAAQTTFPDFAFNGEN
jgi:hypothetical protein